MEPTRNNEFTPDQEILAVALELASGKWKLALQDGKRRNPTIKTVDGARPEERLSEVIAEMNKFKTKYGLPQDVRTVVLYEAGQDGFWIARRLMTLGYEALICDPASLMVKRQARRAKTDRLDAIALVTALRAWLGGEEDRMRIVHVPSVEDEGARQLVRDRGELQKEAMQHRDRMRKLLRLEGCWDSLDGDFAKRLADGKVCRHDGTPLPRQMMARLERECERLAFVERQFAELEANLVSELPPAKQERIATLQRLCGVGVVSATRLELELFWRKFKNRKQVAAAVGLVPQPYDSGESRVDQGISKQGNRRVRSLLIELSWFWLKYQPDSAISRWFAGFTAGAKSKRCRRIAIVGVARRLTIALWRYLEHGTVPEGAAFKSKPPRRTAAAVVAA